MRFVVVGACYVGLVTAACFVENGNEVIRMDVGKSGIEMLRQGKVPFCEPDLDELRILFKAIPRVLEGIGR